ncbi:hypothetical protein GCM10011354_26580 [Egicoccus halophilus]|uniref:Uncharacterized protein n=1 Tax=Egicoccus halophilus TaxID=1670830 RepID=A0A8J3EUL2_9ACTN|nr:hypothetical protein GCM10011354_26580 [Egicoccus halophilus]
MSVPMPGRSLSAKDTALRDTPAARATSAMVMRPGRGVTGVAPWAGGAPSVAGAPGVGGVPSVGGAPGGA